MPTGTESPDTLVLQQRAWEPVGEALLDVTDERVLVKTTKLLLTISRAPLRLTFQDPSGKLCKEILSPLGIKLATIRKPWLKLSSQRYAYTNWSDDIDCTWKSMQELARRQ